MLPSNTKERPILMSAPMVRAVLADHKTQTRRIVKPRGDVTAEHMAKCGRCPYGEAGDRLWVRETWKHEGEGEPAGPHRCRFKATDEPFYTGMNWKPSIHMPRWASRITLEITDIRVERLNDISYADCHAEGLPLVPCMDDQADPLPIMRHVFRDLWQSINGPGSWDLNPWVWAISFRRVNQGGSRED